MRNDHDLKSPFNHTRIPVLSKTSDLHVTRGPDGDEALFMTVK